MYKSQLIFDKICKNESNEMRVFRIFGKKSPMLSQSEVICYNRHKAIYTGILRTGFFAGKTLSKRLSRVRKALIGVSEKDWGIQNDKYCNL